MNVNMMVVWSIIPNLDAAEVAADILGRMDSNSDESLMQAIDDGLIYTSDCWRVLAAYCTPQDANWDTAIEAFTDDLFQCVAKGAVEFPEDDDDEDEVWNLTTEQED